MECAKVALHNNGSFSMHKMLEQVFTSIFVGKVENAEAWRNPYLWSMNLISMHVPTQFHIGHQQCVKAVQRAGNIADAIIGWNERNAN